MKEVTGSERQVVGLFINLNNMKYYKRHGIYYKVGRFSGLEVREDGISKLTPGSIDHVNYHVATGLLERVSSEEFYSFHDKIKDEINKVLTEL